MGQIVEPIWCGQQQRPLLGREDLRRPRLGRPVDPQPGFVEAPLGRTALRLREVLEVLAFEEGLAHVRDAAFDPGLVFGVGNTCGVDHEAARLGIFVEGVVDAWIRRVRFVDDRFQVIRDDDLEDPLVERPRRLEAVDDRCQRLLVGEPHEHVAGEDGGEDQRPQQAPALGIRIEQQTHLAEVDLELGARLAVVDSHRVIGLRVAELLNAEAVQGAVGDDLTGAAVEQVSDLGELDLVLELALDKLCVVHEQFPITAAPVARAPPHPDRLEHGGEQVVGELVLCIA